MFVAKKAPPLGTTYGEAFGKPHFLKPPAKPDKYDDTPVLTTDHIAVIDNSSAPHNDNIQATVALSHSNNHKLHELEAKMNRIEGKLDQLIALMKSK